MAWKQSTLDAVCAGLRNAATSGRFVPGKWIASHNGPDGCPAGCAWGLIGWFVALAIGGPAFARQQLPVGSWQEDINDVLMRAGLTEDEIRRMAPENTWKYFDNELQYAYENRLENWQAYIMTSLRLAEYFVKVVNRIPVGEVTIVRPPSTAPRQRLLPWDDLPDPSDLLDSEADAKLPIAA